MDNGLFTLIAATGAYLLAKNGGDKQVAELEERINEVNDQLVYTTSTLEERLAEADTTSIVRPDGFAGLVTGWKAGDIQISYRWYVHFVNRSGVAAKVAVSNCNVTLFGQSQIARTSVNVGYTLRANEEAWLLCGAGNTKRVFPKKTIRSHVGAYHEVSDNASCTVEYALTGAYINSGVPTDSVIQTVSGKCLFGTTIAVNNYGWNRIVGAGLAESWEASYMHDPTSNIYSQ